MGLLNPATGASFSPNGRFIVVSSRDRTAQIFNGDNGLRLAILTGHEDGVNTASFGPGGRTLVTASEDGSARIWDRERKTSCRSSACPATRLSAERR